MRMYIFAGLDETKYKGKNKVVKRYCLGEIGEKELMSNEKRFEAGTFLK